MKPTFVYKVAAASAIALTLLSTTSAFADSSSNSAEANWRMSMIGPGTLSLKESELATSKATNRMVKDFAGFETAEQKALGTILKELQTPVPDMTAEDQATLQKLKDTPKGAEFDKMYIQDQIDGHKKLGKINSSYLDNADASSTDPKDMESRHLSIFIKQAIDQHIANTKEISMMLNK